MIYNSVTVSVDPPLVPDNISNNFKFIFFNAPGICFWVQSILLFRIINIITNN